MNFYVTLEKTENEIIVNMHMKISFVIKINFVLTLLAKKNMKSQNHQKETGMNQKQLFSLNLIQVRQLSKKSLK